MKKRFLFLTSIILGYFAPVNSTPMRSPDVSAMTTGADLVVVGQVATVTQQGKTTLDLPGDSISATKFRASLRVDRLIKGDPKAPNVVFDFLLPDAPIGWQGLAVGQYGIFFFKAAQGHWEFVDPKHPALPATPNASLLSGAPLDQVTALLGQVLTSPQTRDEDCTRVLDALGQLRTDSAREALRMAMGVTSGERRLTIAGTLVAHNDIAGLDPVATALLHPAGLSLDMRLNLPAALLGMKDPKAVPTLARLVRANNPEINQFAAAALRQSGSVAALEPLSHLLDDPDVKTRYYAVIGFGEITHQDDWAPAYDEFQQNEQHYLSYWRVWAQTNLH